MDHHKIFENKYKKKNIQQRKCRLIGFRFRFVYYAGPRDVNLAIESSLKVAATLRNRGNTNGHEQVPGLGRS